MTGSTRCIGRAGFDNVAARAGAFGRGGAVGLPRGIGLIGLGKTTGGGGFGGSTEMTSEAGAASAAHSTVSLIVGVSAGAACGDVSGTLSISAGGSLRLRSFLAPSDRSGKLYDSFGKRDILVIAGTAITPNDYKLYPSLFNGRAAHRGLRLGCSFPCCQQDNQERRAQQNKNPDMFVDRIRAVRIGRQRDAAVVLHQVEFIAPQMSHLACAIHPQCESKHIICHSSCVPWDECARCARFPLCKKRAPSSISIWIAFTRPSRCGTSRHCAANQSA